ncbi:hypothetical protein E2562_007500 [Oryza meyeriana var. granulata]|uniref:MADS-box domain-containing protein n=1 Tax=Oryza meyeriana var. granulata TaxID=110450 RepID=A0A6G1DV93_9ORYZ|nr:hypothetical protein E2562_007500 [Oryza meyeriana var. granulata]
MPRRKLVLKLIDNEKKRKATYKNRREGLVQKVSQFATLCDVDAFLICVGPAAVGGEVTTWPPDSSFVLELIERLRALPPEKIRQVHNSHSLLREDLDKQQRALLKPVPGQPPCLAYQMPPPPCLELVYQMPPPTLAAAPLDQGMSGTCFMDGNLYATDVMHGGVETAGLLGDHGHVFAAGAGYDDDILGHGFAFAAGTGYDPEPRMTAADVWPMNTLNNPIDGVSFQLQNDLKGLLPGSSSSSNLQGGFQI